MITRRAFVTGMSAVLAYTLMPGGRSSLAGPRSRDALDRAFADIEAQIGGRLGVAVHDPGSGMTAARRGDERFPLCSTFKWLAAAAILARVDQGKDTLDRPIEIRAEDLSVSYTHLRAHETVLDLVCRLL